MKNIYLITFSAFSQTLTYPTQKLEESILMALCLI